MGIDVSKRTLRKWAHAEDWELPYDFELPEDWELPTWKEMSSEERKGAHKAMIKKYGEDTKYQEDINEKGF